MIRIQHRGGKALLLAAVGLVPGCGHDVSPAGDFQDPASIPVCCVSDFDEQCCGIAAFAFAGGVQVSWNAEDAIFGFVDGWIIFRATGEMAPLDSAYQRINPVLFTAREFVDGDIEDGEHYWYRIASVSPAGVESLPSRAVSVRADFTPPASPTGLRAEVTGGRVALEWNASPEPDLDHYNVFRDPDFPPFVFPRAPFPQYLDGDVEADSTYRYWVTAVDQGLNESAPSETVEVTVTP